PRMGRRVREYRMARTMHGLVVLAIVVVRILLSLQGDSSRTPTRPRAVSLWVRIVFLVLASVLATRAPLWAVAFLVLTFPFPVVDFLLVPAGVPHLTYYFTRTLRPHSIAEEAQGGATFHELRARLYRGIGLGDDPTKRLTLALAPVFDEPDDLKVRGSTVVARGILDALRGHFDSARELFGVVEDMRWSHAPLAARAYAQAWLLADAAQRGAHHEVVRLAARGPKTLRRKFFEACSRRLLGNARGASKARLVFLWLAAPARFGSFGLLRRALGTAPRKEIEPQGSDLAAVTRATLALLRLPRGSVSRRELFRLAEAWQVVFDGSELSSRLEKRREELGANFGVSAISNALDLDLTALFAELLRESLAEDEPPGDEPWLVTAAKDALQSELLGELESLASELPSDKSKRCLGYDRYWRAWAHLRSLAATFVDVLPERRELIYDAVGSNVWNHAVWLHNEERSFLLAHDIFRWLEHSAPADSESKRALGRNAELGQKF
ncbi:MAG TPA: hypothetical protein VF103_18765, partial [Polyangiaceae bacterium]